MVGLLRAALASKKSTIEGDAEEEATGKPGHLVLAPFGHARRTHVPCAQSPRRQAKNGGAGWWSTAEIDSSSSTRSTTCGEFRPTGCCDREPGAAQISSVRSAVLYSNTLRYAA